MLAALLVVLPVFGLIALGYVARWTRLLRETTGEGLSDFVFWPRPTFRRPSPGATGSPISPG
jgi:hypothetical protein